MKYIGIALVAGVIGLAAGQSIKVNCEEILSKFCSVTTPYSFSVVKK